MDRVARPGFYVTAALLLIGWGFGLDQPQFRYEHRQTSDPNSIHILAFDPTAFQVELVLAADQIIGRETVSHMARRTRALAAINGGFFRIARDYDGEPAGALKIASRWLSEPQKNRGALGWTRDGKLAKIDRLRLHSSLVIGNRDFPIHGINRPRGSSEAIFYTPEFPTQFRPKRGTELMIGTNDRVVAAGTPGLTGSSEFKVYSSGPQGPLRLKDVVVGRSVRVEHRVQTFFSSGSRWDQLDFVLGGTPVLVHQGQGISNFSVEQVPDDFVTRRHPRTAVCIQQNEDWVLVVVDGRQPRVSVGMTLQELTALLIELGCRDALNLDGGGSSTFYLSGRVLNRPSDPRGERPVSDALIVKPRSNSVPVP